MDLAGKPTDLIANITWQETSGWYMGDVASQSLHLIEKDPKIRLYRLMVDHVLPIANGEDATKKARACSAFRQVLLQTKLESANDVKRVGDMLLQAAINGPVIEVRKEASLGLIHLLNLPADLAQELKELIQPQAREFTLSVLKCIHADTDPEVVDVVPGMIDIFPKEMNLIMSDIVEHFVNMFSSRLERQYDTSMSEIISKDQTIPLSLTDRFMQFLFISRLKQQEISIARGQIPTRNKTILINLRNAVKRFNCIARSSGKNEFVSRLEPVAIDCILQVISAHEQDLPELIDIIIEILAEQTSDQVTMDAFRAFEPLCSLLKQKELVSTKLVDSSKPLLKNYIKSKGFAQSIERNATIVFDLYQTFDRLDCSDCSVLKILLVRLESLSDKILAEKIMEFFITRWQVHEKSLEFTLARHGFLLTGFCYYQDIMFKIFIKYQLSQEGKKLQGLFNMFFTFWSVNNWTEDGDWHDRRMNIMAVIRLLNARLDKQQAMVSDKFLAGSVRKILIFYLKAIEGRYGGLYFHPIFDPIEAWISNEIGYWSAVNELEGEGLDTYKLIDLLWDFAASMSQLKASNSSADTRFFRILTSHLNKREKKTLKQMIRCHRLNHEHVLVKLCEIMRPNKMKLSVLVVALSAALIA